MDQTNSTATVTDGPLPDQFAQDPAAFDRLIDAEVRAYDALTNLAMTIERGLQQRIAAMGSERTNAPLSPTDPAGTIGEVDPQVEE